MTVQGIVVVEPRVAEREVAGMEICWNRALVPSRDMRPGAGQND